MALIDVQATAPFCHKLGPFEPVRLLILLCCCYALRFALCLPGKQVCKIVRLNFWECVKTIKQDHLGMNVAPDQTII